MMTPSVVQLAAIKLIGSGAVIAPAVDLALEGVAGASPSLLTAILASGITALALLLGILLKNYLTKKELAVKDARVDAIHATGSADKIVEVLAEYRTHIDQLMTDHMTRVQEFYGVQIRELQIAIKQRDSVIELQNSLIAELKALPKPNA